MQLKSTLNLLKYAQDAFPIQVGNGTHSVCLINNKLSLIINDGFIFRTFFLDEVDLDKNPVDLIAEIKKMINEKEVTKNAGSTLCTT